MNCEFNERTFEYAYVVEFCRLFGVSNIPDFVSSNRENLLGYDVNVDVNGTPYFFQFKVSDYLYNPNAMEYRNYGINLPYFRFRLHRKNRYNQHNLLVKLNKKYVHVYYCAPHFYLKKELNKHGINSSILDNSVAFTPNQMRLTRRDTHHRVIYNRDNNCFYFLSRKVEISPRSIKELLPIGKQKINRSLFEQILSNASAIVLREIRYNTALRQKALIYSGKYLPLKDPNETYAPREYFEDNTGVERIKKMRREIKKTNLPDLMLTTYEFLRVYFNVEGLMV